MYDTRAISPFGSLLRSHRLAAGLTQELLAERSGVAKRTLQDLELGASRPRRATVRRLIEALRLTPEDQALFEAATSAPRQRTGQSAEGYGHEASPDDLRDVGGAGVRCPASAPRQKLIPTELTSFIGREQELAELQTLLETRRLLTLTGPGGSGKTRLALELTARVKRTYSDGVYVVSLAPLADPGLVPATIGEAFGMHETTSESLSRSLARVIGEKTVLLLLDNFEHLVSAGPLVIELLSACPRLTVLVTSREVLRLRGEQAYPVLPLPLPEVTGLPSNGGDLVAMVSESPAVRLFVDRAQSAEPGFRLTSSNALAAVDICLRLDGLPLAIELAAARVPYLTPDALRRHLEHRLRLLTGGPRDLPARQRTLRAAIAWSHDLLGEDERTLFRRVSIFAGSCSPDAIQAVCAVDGGLESDLLDGLGSLVTKSLLYRLPGYGDELRFGMLETIREFATEQLEASGELPGLRDRHLAYYLAFAEAAEAELRGPRQAEWFDRLERQNDNLRAALEWAATAGEVPFQAAGATPHAQSRVEVGIRLADALEFFWILRGHARENLPRVMALAMLAAPETAARARGLLVAAHVRGIMLGDHRAALPLAAEAERIWRALGNRHGIAMAFVRRGMMAAFGAGDYPGAMALLTEARAAFRDIGEEVGPENPITSWLAQAARGAGEDDRALALLDESVAESRARGDGHALAFALREVAGLWQKRGKAEDAIILLRECLAALKPLKDIRCVHDCLEHLASLLSDRRAPRDVARLFGAADGLRMLSGRRLTPALRSIHDPAVAAVERKLDPQSFATAWAEGQGLTLEQAITLALDETEPT